MAADKRESEIERPDTGWSRALRESSAICPDLTARVQSRMIRARTVRRGALAAAALMAVAGLAWLWSPLDTKPMLAIEKTPAKRLPPPARGETETLAVPSPIAHMRILDDQQAALWAGLEKLTEDL